MLGGKNKKYERTSCSFYIRKLAASLNRGLEMTRESFVGLEEAVRKENIGKCQTLLLARIAFEGFFVIGGGPVSRCRQEANLPKRDT